LLLQFPRYDTDEGNSLFDADSASFFLGDDASLQKKETELAKRLVFIYTNYALFLYKFLYDTAYI